MLKLIAILKGDFITWCPKLIQLSPTKRYSFRKENETKQNTELFWEHRGKTNLFWECLQRKGEDSHWKRLERSRVPLKEEKMKY